MFNKYSVKSKLIERIYRRLSLLLFILFLCVMTRFPGFFATGHAGIAIIEFVFYIICFLFVLTGVPLILQADGRRAMELALTAATLMAGSYIAIIWTKPYSW